MSSWLSLLWSSTEKLLLFEMMVDSNRFVEKFGRPQFTQCHEMLFSAMYTGVDMCMHSTWYQQLQSSQATPLCFHVTAFSHIWHGYLIFLGPGFNSTSDANKINSAVMYSAMIQFTKGSEGIPSLPPAALAAWDRPENTPTTLVGFTPAALAAWVSPTVVFVSFKIPALIL